MEFDVTSLVVALIGGIALIVSKLIETGKWPRKRKVVDGDGAFEQFGGGILTGTVVDSKGALLAGIVITIIHERTSARRETRSGSSGAFTISALAPGRYVLQAALAGFQSTELAGIAVGVEDRVDVKLELDLAA